MGKERQLFLLSFIFIVFMMGFVFAANETNSSRNNTGVSVNSNEDLQGIDKAYQCLRDEIDKKSSLSLEEAIFSALALGSNSKAINKIEDEKKSGENCWPKAGCKLVDTSQVLLVYDKIGKDTKGIKDWINSKKKTASELTWYLEIDIQNHEASSCKIKYDNSERTITVNNDLTLSGSGGSCLSVSSNGYWLKINNDCLEKEFEINCKDDFITSLLYQRGASGTLYVSSETHSAPSLGTTKEKVNSYCFNSGGNDVRCDYESTLWGALALDKEGEDTDALIPYLTALEENNVKFFPSSFLYILRADEESYNDLIQKQKSNKYWEIAGSPGNRFYDTSLAMLSLAGTGATEFENARTYLLDIQQDSGCWDNNNLKSTGFVLYSGWPRAGVSSGGGTGGSTNCVASGNYCESQIACLETGGLVLNSFECSNFREVCCSVDVKQLSCNEQSGILCSSSQQCDGRSISSIDGTCCLGACVNKQIESTCEISGGSCRTSCFSDEEQNAESCSFSGDVCCVEGTEESNKGISTWVWILLVLLIILVILGIMFRNKIRLWMYKRRGDASSRPMQQIPRGPPGFGMTRPMQRRPVPSFGVRRQIARPLTKGSRNENEFSETMRKLQEMSK